MGCKHCKPYTNAKCKHCKIFYHWKDDGVHFSALVCPHCGRMMYAAGRAVFTAFPCESYPDGSKPPTREEYEINLQETKHELRTSI